MLLVGVSRRQLRLCKDILFKCFRNGQRVTKTETTITDKNGNKKVEITEEIDDGRGNISKNTKQLIGDTDYKNGNSSSKRQIK